MRADPEGEPLLQITPVRGPSLAAVCRRAALALTALAVASVVAVGAKQARAPAQDQRGARGAEDLQTVGLFGTCSLAPHGCSGPPGKSPAGEDCPSGQCCPDGHCCPNGNCAPSGQCCSQGPAPPSQPAFPAQPSQPAQAAQPATQGGMLRPQACSGVVPPDCPDRLCCSGGSCCPSYGRCWKGNCWLPANPSKVAKGPSSGSGLPVLPRVPPGVAEKRCVSATDSGDCLRITGCRWFSYTAPCPDCEKWIGGARHLTGCHAWDTVEYCHDSVFLPMQRKSGLPATDPALLGAVKHYRFSLGSDRGGPRREGFACDVWCDPAGSGCSGQPKVDGGLRGASYGGRFVPEEFLDLAGHGYLFGPIQKPPSSKDKSVCDIFEADGGSRMSRYLDDNIKQEHFAKMAELGFNIVRLPLGYWNLIDLPAGSAPDGPPDMQARWRNLQKLMPAASYAKWIDKVFDFAALAGMTVMPDLHSAPGGQSGNECTGCDQGPDAKFFFLSPDGETGRNVELAVQAVEQMAKICASKGETCYGIELLNEPYGAHVDTWYMSDLANDLTKCAATDLDACTGIRLFFGKQQLQNPQALVQQLEQSRSSHTPGPPVRNTSREALRVFYSKSIKAARAHLAKDKPIVVMDWPPWLTWWMENSHYSYEEHGHMVFSTHLYKFPQPWSSQLQEARNSFQRDIERLKDFSLNSGYPLMVSEYALNSHGSGDGSDGFDYNAYASWCVHQFEQFTLGSMIWNYDSKWTAWGSIASQQVGQSFVDWRKINEHREHSAKGKKAALWSMFR